MVVGRVMRDAELDELRARVDCRTVLERAGWTLDRGESTANAMKYRLGTGRIVIVTHQGKGWFDAVADGRGDVLALAQYLHGGTLGHARRRLRPLAGIAPTLAMAPRVPGAAAGDTEFNAQAGWAGARRLREGSHGWAYLTGERGLPPDAVWRAARAGVAREGIHGTVWFLHRSGLEWPVGWEMRGPGYKGYSKGGDKALFWIGDLGTARRVAVTEAAIDALSLATLEGWPDGTAYLSTGGGFGPLAADAMGRLLPQSARLVAATDRGRGGELLAGRLATLAAGTGRAFCRCRPTAADWNDQLRGL